MNRGYNQIYTGNGKGKSTAAFGLAVRALGHDRNLCIIQFLKKDSEYGEFKMLSKVTEIMQFGTGKFVDFENPSNEDISCATEGFSKAKEAVFSKKYDMVILDEIAVAVSLNLITEEEVVDLMKNKPSEVELILTGRGATQKMIETADLVTEMKEVKHYFKKNVTAREGIEY